jgi:hypothetical protein
MEALKSGEPSKASRRSPNPADTEIGSTNPRARAIEALEGWIEYSRQNVPPTNFRVFEGGETLEQEFHRLKSLRHKDPKEWLRVVSPKVIDFGLRKGMTRAQIDAKLERYSHSGPLPDDRPF